MKFIRVGRVLEKIITKTFWLTFFWDTGMLAVVTCMSISSKYSNHRATPLQSGSKTRNTVQVSSAVESLQPRGARPDAATASGGNNVTVTSACLPEFSKVGAWPSCYRFSTFNSSWHEAREYCSAFGANLLALDSLKEAHIIDYLLNSKPGLSGV